MILWLKFNPKPIPAPTGFVVKKGESTSAYLTEPEHSALGGEIGIGVRREFPQGMYLGFFTSVGWLNIKVKRNYTTVFNGLDTTDNDVKNLELFPVYAGLEVGYHF